MYHGCSMCIEKPVFHVSVRHHSRPARIVMPDNYPHDRFFNMSPTAILESNNPAIKWVRAWQNQHNDLCPQRKLRSAWASAQSDQSSLSPWRNLASLATHWVHREDWSNWADAQADLSLCWTHRSYCWFCHAVAQVTAHHKTSGKMGANFQYF